MAYNFFTPLFNKIVDSSIWEESNQTRILWVTMLAIKDRDNIVRGYSAYSLGRKANLSEKEVLDSLKVLSEPDTKRLEPQPHDGRRIKKMEDGWLILNGDVYQKIMSQELVKARNRRGQENWRKNHADDK